MIRGLGYEIDFAKWEEALQKYQAMSIGRKFDIVIPDLTIRGGLGGKETDVCLRGRS